MFKLPIHYSHPLRSEKETTHELAVQFEDKKFKTIYSGLE